MRAHSTGPLLFSLLVLTAKPCPALAFGDPAQAGAAAWCGARKNGASVEIADKQLRSAISAQLLMSTNFTSAVVGLANSRQALQSQINFHISTMCPEYL
jgi:hypothetical protein